MTLNEYRTDAGSDTVINEARTTTTRPAVYVYQARPIGQPGETRPFKNIPPHRNSLMDVISIDLRRTELNAAAMDEAVVRAERALRQSSEDDQVNSADAYALTTYRAAAYTTASSDVADIPYRTVIITKETDQIDCLLVSPTETDSDKQKPTAYFLFVSDTDEVHFFATEPTVQPLVRIPIETARFRIGDANVIGCLALLIVSGDQRTTQVVSPNALSNKVLQKILQLDFSYLTPDAAVQQTINELSNVLAIGRHFVGIEPRG